jgi:hypothetical protein
VTALRRRVEQAERATGARRGPALEAAAVEAQRLAGTAVGKDAERLEGIAATLRAVAAR